MEDQNCRGKSAVIWLIPVMMAAFVIVWLVTERPEEEKTGWKPKGTISCAEAAKALALSQTDQQNCFSLPKTHVARKEQGSWYAPYLEYVRERGWMSECDAEDTLTIGDLDTVAMDLGLLPDILPESGASMSQLTVSAEGFWRLYGRICEAGGSKDAVTELETVVYGTTGTVTGAPAWTAYTDAGVLSYAGLKLDGCSDQKVRVLQRDGEILHLQEVVSETVTYTNVWLIDWKEDALEIYWNGIRRSFLFPEGDATYMEQIADLTITKGVLSGVRKKEEEIRGKVLAVTDGTIEIAGCGSFPIRKDACFYKGYGNLEMQSTADILVGYDLQRFTVENGEICAGVMTQTFRAENIRVLLRTTGFSDIFHESVTLTGLGDFYVCYGNTREFHEAGERVTLTPESSCFGSGRVIVKTAQENRGLCVESIVREQGSPVYRGTLEIRCGAEGLTIVNELLLEDYLREVVPSEVPSSYGAEALETQAICARSYAWLKIRENALRQYGAHVDDSENYQVYNNLEENEAASQAVRNTYGQVLTYGGNVVNTYYFSTSCGSTTDPSVWGSAPDAVPYLKVLEVSAEAKQQRQAGAAVEVSVNGYDLSKEEDFRSFMENPPESAYEKDCEWFRWTVDATLLQLEESIGTMLLQRIGQDGEHILFRQEDGSFCEASELQTVPETGKIQSVEVTARSGGGSVQELLITGEKQTVKVIGQGNVRMLLGNTDYTYWNVRGESSGNRELLQSSFFWLEELYEGETLTGYRIHGGGKGHGIGMSQNAMNQMSLTGMTAEEILSFFYPGTAVEGIY